MRNLEVLLDKQSGIDFCCATIRFAKSNEWAESARLQLSLAIFFFDFPCSVDSKRNEEKNYYFFRVSASDF